MMGINPLAHILDLLFVGRNTKGEVCTGALEGFVELKFVVRINRHFGSAEVLVEEVAEVELGDRGIVDQIVESS